MCILDWTNPDNIINTPFSTSGTIDPQTREVLVPDKIHPQPQFLLSQKEQEYEKLLRQQPRFKLPNFFKAKVREKDTGKEILIHLHPLNLNHIFWYAAHFAKRSAHDVYIAFQDCFVELMQESYNKGEHMAKILKATPKEADERSIDTFRFTVNLSNYSVLVTLAEKERSHILGKGIGFLGGCDNLAYIKGFYKRPFQRYSKKFDPIYEVLRKLTFTYYSPILKPKQAVYLYRGAAHRNYQGLGLLEKIVFLINTSAKLDGYTHSFGEATNAFSGRVLASLDYKTIATVPYRLFTDSRGRRIFATVPDTERIINPKSGKAPVRTIRDVEYPTSACVLMVKALSHHSYNDPFIREIPPQEVQGISQQTVWDRWTREDIDEEQYLMQMRGPGPQAPEPHLLPRGYPSEAKLEKSRNEALQRATNRRKAGFRTSAQIEEQRITAARIAAEDLARKE